MTSSETAAVGGRFKLKAYRVACEGFNSHLYYAGSRGKALSKAWDAYCSYQPISFKDFLRIARCWREHLTPPFGDPIWVNGRDAFFVSKDTQYVQFAYPGETNFFNAHPFDVEPEQYRSEPYRTPASAKVQPNAR